MVKKILILGVLMVMAFSLGACENKIPYNAVMYDDAGKWIAEQFLLENITQGAYFEGINTDDNSYPKSVARLIKSGEEFEAIFTEFPLEIDFDKSIVCIYVFTCNYVRPYKINKIVVDNQTLKIEVKSVKPKEAVGDAVRSWQRCLVVKMDKTDVISVEFTEK